MTLQIAYSESHCLSQELLSYAVDSYGAREFRPAFLSFFTEGLLRPAHLSCRIVHLLRLRILAPSLPLEPFEIHCSVGSRHGGSSRVLLTSFQDL